MNELKKNKAYIDLGTPEGLDSHFNPSQEKDDELFKKVTLKQLIIHDLPLSYWRGKKQVSPGFVLKLLLNELAMTQGGEYYPFYSAQYVPFTMIAEILKCFLEEVSNQTFGSGYVLLSPRLLTANQYKNIPDFLDKMIERYGVRDNSGEIIDIGINDTRLEYVSIALCANISLFGGEHEDENTFLIFKQHSGIHNDIEKYLEPFLRAINFSRFQPEKYYQVFNEYLSRIPEEKQSANLYQIFIHKTALDEITYPSADFGYPLWVKNKDGKEMILPTFPILEEYKKNYRGLQDIIDHARAQVGKGRGLGRLENPNQIQIRVLKKTSVVINPQLVKVKVYQRGWKEGMFTEYKQKIKELVRQDLAENPQIRPALIKILDRLHIPNNTGN